MEEKPFCCPMANCNLKFTNEDHLAVHKKKHELSLTLTPSGYKNPFIVDQTPTPTRFLEPDMFQDLSDNPFDATFRRANSNGGSQSIVIPESSSLLASLPDSEVLNTPSIILPSEPATPVLLKPVFPKKQTKVAEISASAESSDSLPFSPIIQSVSADSTVTDNQSSENSSSPVDTSLSALSDDDTSQNRVQPKIVSVTSVITSANNSALKPGVGVPTAVVTRSTSSSISTISSSQISAVAQPVNQAKIQEPVQAVVQPICVNPGVQFMIRLADGQTFQLPLVAATPAPSQPLQTSSVTPPLSNAKLKLKESLTTNAKNVANNVNKNIASKAKPPEPVEIIPDSSERLVLPPSQPSKPLLPHKSAHIGRKRRDTVDDPDEKRKRSLERNRAAATRCREKRKMWITALERKADELALTNAHLQNEVAQLRNEVAHLKTLLLAHKDCPVTLQQKASGYDVDKDNCTTICIITSSDDVQRVPASSVVLPLDSDFMDMDVSSVQSSSDASLASDSSEPPFQER